jgi:hypothetical protein
MTKILLSMLSVAILFFFIINITVINASESDNEKLDQKFKDFNKYKNEEAPKKIEQKVKDPHENHIKIDEKTSIGGKIKSGGAEGNVTRTTDIGGK